MNEERYSRQISLLCPTCGHNQFHFEEDDADSDDCIFECPHCKLTLTKAELIERNSEIIDAGVDGMVEDVLTDLTDALKKAFRGNQHIEVK